MKKCESNRAAKSVWTNGGGRFHHHTHGDIVLAVRTIFYHRLGADGEPALDFRIVIHEEMDGPRLLIFLHDINGEARIADGANLSGDGPTFGRWECRRAAGLSRERLAPSRSGRTTKKQSGEGENGSKSHEAFLRVDSPG